MQPEPCCTTEKDVFNQLQHGEYGDCNEFMTAVILLSSIDNIHIYIYIHTCYMYILHRIYLLAGRMLLCGLGGDAPVTDQQSVRLCEGP